MDRSWNDDELWHSDRIMDRPAAEVPSEPCVLGKHLGLISEPCKSVQVV